MNVHLKDGSGASFSGKGILFLTHEYAPFRGGVATYVEELAAAIHQQDPEVRIHILTLGTNLQIDKSSAVPIERLGGNLNIRLGSRLRLIREMLRRRNSGETWVLCSYGALFAMMVLQTFAPGRFPPYLILVHGSELLKFERNAFLRILSKKAFARSMAAAATSHHVCERMLCSYLGRFIPHGFVLPCGPSAWLSKALPRAEIPPAAEPMPGGRLRILTLARIHPRKGQLDTAKALGLLPSSLKSRLLWILAGTGDQAYLEEILATCRQNGVTVEVRGEVPPDQMAATYAACDLYVMSSRSLRNSLEGFGMTYLEAAWFGKPSVGYRTGGVSEAVRHQETGLLVDEGDIGALGKAVAQLLEAPALRRRMARSAAHHARSFDWNYTASLLLAFLEKSTHAR